jgi:serine phosphatase RsbU (regulator of sigma subunit)
LVYTDGVSEAMNEKMEEFGKERLQGLIQRTDGGCAAALIERILAAVAAHVHDATQSDDMTLVLLQRSRAGG